MDKSSGFQCQTCLCIFTVLLLTPLCIINMLGGELQVHFGVWFMVCVSVKIVVLAFLLDKMTDPKKKIECKLATAFGCWRPRVASQWRR